MMKKIINVIFASTLLLLAGCTDSQPDSPEPAPDSPLTISYSAAGFGEGIHSRAEQHYCDPDLNEGKVEKLDLLLVDASGNILDRYSTTDDATANRCDGTEHILITVREDHPKFSRQNIRREGNRLVLIANLDADLENLNNISNLNDLSNLIHNQIQDKFVMIGELASSEVKETGNVNIELERVAAKIRITLYNPVKSDAGNYIATKPGSKISEFESTLCHYVTDSPVMKEAKELTKAGKTSTVPCHGQDWPDFFAGEPELTLENGIIKENAHIFYTYPTDWYNYSNSAPKPCDNKSHNSEGSTVHEAGKSYYKIGNYDDEEPIIAARQVFAIVYAEYEGNGKKYYYKVPINYRLSKLNDRQCFSSKELDEKVLSLYRADRNHFYDVTAIIDRPGAGTPEEAINNPMFTATIAPLTDGGTFDYIYD